MIFNLLLEYASGGSLSDLINKSSNRGLPESDVKRYTRSILRGLARIHECGFVHCDLKPDNILLVPVSSKNSFNGFNYMAKIADFGLSKAVKQNKRGRWDIGLRGTPVYLAPETVAENIQGPQSDIWALGCVVFEMLTGIWGEDRNMSFEDVCRLIGDENGLPEIPSGISRMGRNFLKACLVRKPMYRSSPEVLLDHPFIAGIDDDFWEGDESQEQGLDLGTSVMGENEDIPCYCSVFESESESDCSGSILVEESCLSSWSGDFGDDEVLLVRKSATFCECGDHSFALPAQPLKDGSWSMMMDILVLPLHNFVDDTE
ncbi:Mitogen-activated protein kinase kinase [Quillaja saponaria]|uniref:Mitogen-activated protein kinase kinase n=1 Tax=Quillaja saponaria TaxID=32244 RepID=A0AAD7KMV5_QUISA|nr:Mitogen-activated protein kinase kinase [Quillaja saponaria]